MKNPNSMEFSSVILTQIVYFFFSFCNSFCFNSRKTCNKWCASLQHTVRDWVCSHIIFWFYFLFYVFWSRKTNSKQIYLKLIYLTANLITNVGEKSSLKTSKRGGITNCFTILQFKIKIWACKNKYCYCCIVGFYMIKINFYLTKNKMSLLLLL